MQPEALDQLLFSTSQCPHINHHVLCSVVVVELKYVYSLLSYWNNKQQLRLEFEFAWAVVSFSGHGRTHFVCSSRH